MKHFVLVFDRADGRLLSEKDFSDARAALRERFAAELLHRGNPSIEVVVLGATDSGTLRRTHARYFQDVASLSRSGVDMVRAAEATVAAAAR